MKYEYINIMTTDVEEYEIYGWEVSSVFQRPVIIADGKYVGSVLMRRRVR